MSSSPGTDSGRLAHASVPVAGGVKAPIKTKPISTTSGTVISNASSTATGALQTCGKPGFRSLPEAQLSSHMQGQAQASAIASSLHAPIIQPDALAVESPDRGEALATDALVVEALDATGGAFPSVADAIEAANFGSGIGLAANSFDERGVPGRGNGSGTVTPSGIDPNASSTGVSTAKRAGSARFVGGPRVHPPAPESTTKPPNVTPSGIDSNPSFTVDPTANRAGAASSGGGPGVHPPALESGSRPPAVSTLRREPHPFLTTENAKAYAQDPRMEGLTIDIDDEYPSKIQHLPWNVFLTPRERGASLQDEYLAAHYATKQLRNGELIRRVCDDWNYNAANSYTPNDLRQGPITVWPQGRVTPAMRASYGDCARFWSKQVRLVADVPMEFRSFDDDAAAKVTEWRPRPTPFLPQAAVADAVADRLARALLE